MFILVASFERPEKLLGMLAKIEVETLTCMRHEDHL